MFALLVLFSEVHGTVLKNGEPVQGAQIVQEVVWSDGNGGTQTEIRVSDKDGNFSFDAVKKMAGFARILPHETVILQKLTIRYEGIVYAAWQHTKNSYAANSELDGRPLRLNCELTRSPDFEGTHYGIGTAG